MLYEVITDRLGMKDGAQYIGDHAFCDAGREAMERYKPLMTHRTVVDRNNFV